MTNAYEGPIRSGVQGTSSLRPRFLKAVYQHIFRPQGKVLLISFSSDFHFIYIGLC